MSNCGLQIRNDYTELSIKRDFTNFPKLTKMFYIEVFPKIDHDTLNIVVLY